MIPIHLLTTWLKARLVLSDSIRDRLGAIDAELAFKVRDFVLQRFQLVLHDLGALFDVLLLHQYLIGVVELRGFQFTKLFLQIIRLLSLFKCFSRVFLLRLQNGWLHQLIYVLDSLSRLLNEQICLCFLLLLFSFDTVIRAQYMILYLTVVLVIVAEGGRDERFIVQVDVVVGFENASTLSRNDVKVG